MANDKVQKTPSEQSIGKGERILFIEDDEILAKVYHNKLSMVGFKVEGAHDGLEAIEKLKSSNYDLILLDLILPKLDGFSVLGKLRKSDWPSAKKPVLVFSNLGNMDDIEKARNLGANDYFVKTDLIPNQVVEKITQHLGEK